MAEGPIDLHKIIDLAEHAEALGFDSVWVGDSILARPRLEPLTTLAAVAARTQRVKLGTAVLLPALRHPVVLANEVANLDILSGGRVILGVGIAARHPAVEREFAACGVPFSRRLGIFEETVEILRQLWSEPQVTFRGRHFQLENVTAGLRPAGRPTIPFWLGSSAAADNTLRRVVRLADAWFPNPASAAAYAEQWERLQALAREVGRDPNTLYRALYTTINVNDNVQQADDEMRAFVERYYDAPYERLAPGLGLCAGTADACVEWLSRFIEAGAKTIVLRFGGPDQFAQLERCAKEVLPKLRGVVTS